MALRLGLDFGTATTCIATVPNRTEFRPEVIAIREGLPFVDSLAWVTQPAGATPIVKSRNSLGRCPIALFESAHSAFWHYWGERVSTQTDGVRWNRWLRNEREQSMLLSYFKPELADKPALQTARVVDFVRSTYDPMAQSESVNTYYRTRVVANPAPDTDDLVAATAAIIRQAVQAVHDRLRSKVELLLLGMPSHLVAPGNAEFELSASRRRDAVELSGIREAFCTSDFRTELFGEAQAAGFGVDVEADTSEAYGIIIDVGAGTTDMALVPYRADRGRRLIAGDPIANDSLRFAGRDLNEAIARGLRQNKDVERAYCAMDDRSWQILMDEDVERIKRVLDYTERRFRIPFHRYAAAMDNGLWENPTRRALLKTVFLDMRIDSGDINGEISNACDRWKGSVAVFLRSARQMLGSRDVVAIEMVGGAFKFEPLRRALHDAMRLADIDDVPARYRVEGDESQTVVARGLARRAMLLE